MESTRFFGCTISNLKVARKKPVQKFEFKLAQVVLSIFFSLIDIAKGLLSKAVFASLFDLRLAVNKIYPSSF